MNSRGSQLKKCPKCGEIYFNAQAECKKKDCNHVFYSRSERIKRMREKKRRATAKIQTQLKRQEAMKERLSKFVATVTAPIQEEPVVKVSKEEVPSLPIEKNSESLKNGSYFTGIRPETDPYSSLDKVLREAKMQASMGKGKARHGMTGSKFEDQIISLIGLWGLSHAEGQAVKKIVEARTALSDGEAITELLGAINYIASEIIVRRLKKLG